MAERSTGRKPKHRDFRRERRRIRASKSLHWFLRKLFGVIFWLLFKLEAENIGLFQKVKPPFVVLPNHQSAVDPLFVNTLVPGPIHYVVSDSNFRSRLLSFLLGLVGAIPKTKAVSDLETVKNIVRIKAKGGIIGVYPEGQNTWDGGTLPMIPSTAKLIKSLKVPVVIAKVQGAFLSMPRWARGIRRGRVRISFSLGFTPGDLKAMTTDEIRQKMSEHLAHDEFAFQRRVGWTFRSKHRAEYLEIVLFTCPECHKMNTLVSEGNELGCASCGYRVRMASSGFFRRREGRPHFETLLAWNRWQTAGLESMLDEKREVFLKTPVFRERNMSLEKGYKSLPLRPLGTGELLLFSDKLVFVNAENGRGWEFLIPEIEGINVQNNENLEFYHRDSLYKIRNLNRRGNSYKYFAAIRHLYRSRVTP